MKTKLPAPPTLTNQDHHKTLRTARRNSRTKETKLPNKTDWETKLPVDPKLNCFRNTNAKTSGKKQDETYKKTNKTKLAKTARRNLQRSNGLTPRNLENRPKGKRAKVEFHNHLVRLIAYECK